VLADRGVDSAVFREEAKTSDVELGSRIPNEISSECQRSFMGGFLGVK
jgi:hypothetical protein